MPSKNRLTINPPPELTALIQAFRQANGHASDASAAVALLMAGLVAQGYEVPAEVPGWGGKRTAQNRTRVENSC